MRSTVFEDCYKSRAGAFAEAREVFVDGCGLVERWQHAAQFTVLEVGFGLGVSFLATLQRWLDDPQRCARLDFVSLERLPVSAADLAAALRHLDAPGDLAQALVTQWPSAVEGPHHLRFADGRVCLQLILGDAGRWLPRLALRADAIFMDGFAPGRNPDAWTADICRALGRLARTRARLSTYTAAAEVRRQLTAAGFDVERRPGFGGKRERLQGVRADRRAAPGTPARDRPVPTDAARGRHAVIVGAGLAGCAIAEALLARGWRVSLFESGDEAMPDGSASAQPLCAEHLHWSPDDNLLARLSRAAWSLGRHRADRRAVGRVLLAADQAAQAEQQHLIERLDWPAASPMGLTALTAEQASNLSGVDLAQPGLWWSGCAVLAPRTRARALLTSGHPALNWHPGRRVAALRRVPALRPSTEAAPRRDESELARNELTRPDADHWQVLDEGGDVLTCAPVVILANAGGAPALAGLASIPLAGRAGRSLTLTTPALSALRCVLSAHGYVLPLGDGRVVVDPDRPMSAAAGLLVPTAPSRLTERPVVPRSADKATAEPASALAERYAASDRLPVIGPAPDEALIRSDPSPWRRNDRLPLPRQTGLYLACAFGGRGLLWSTLAAEVLAAHLEGGPAPIDRPLLDAIDPARFLRRTLRRGHGPAP